MKNYRFLLIIVIVVVMGLVMVASVNAQGGKGDTLRTHDRLQDQLKDGSCLEVSDPVCPNPDCDGEPDQDRDQLRIHWE